MELKVFIPDICFICKKEKIGDYEGDNDNPIYVCDDCHKERLNESQNHF